MKYLLTILSLFIASIVYADGSIIFSQGGTGQVVIVQGIQGATLSSTQTWSGGNTLRGYTTMLGTTSITGVTDSGNAGTGFVGEYVSTSTVRASSVTLSATDVRTVIATTTLTAGDWVLDAVVCVLFNGAAVTYVQGCPSTASGTNGTGCVLGDTEIINTTAPTANSDSCIIIPGVRFSTAGTPIYLKAAAGYGAGAKPSGFGRISARRVR